VDNFEGVQKQNKYFPEAYESILAWFRRRRIKCFHRTTRSPLATECARESIYFVFYGINGENTRKTMRK